jgi:hypothetical protein
MGGGCSWLRIVYFVISCLKYSWSDAKMLLVYDEFQLMSISISVTTNSFSLTSPLCNLLIINSEPG